MGLGRREERGVSHGVCVCTTVPRCACVCVCDIVLIAVCGILINYFNYITL